jgi:hypothetical protein
MNEVLPLYNKRALLQYLVEGTLGMRTATLYSCITIGVAHWRFRKGRELGAGFEQ